MKITSIIAFLVIGAIIFYVTGGGALLKNLDKLLREESGLPITVTEDPLSTVALGSGMALDSIEILKQVIIT